MTTPKILGDPKLWEALPARSPLVGINPAWLTPSGHLVKHQVLDFDGHMSRTEAMHSEIFRSLGLPHHLVKSFSSPDDRNHYVYAPLESGWAPVDKLTGEQATKLDAATAAKILTAEHILGVDDRHGGNYVVKAGASHATPIDMGTTNSMREFGIGRSALYHAMNFGHEHFRDTPLDTKLLDQLHNLLKDHDFALLGTDHRLHHAFDHLPATPRLGHLA